MSLDPRVFRRRYFGVGSSHPETQAKTARAFVLASLIPLGLICLIAMFVAIEAPDRLFDLDWLLAGIHLAALAIVFALASTATIALCAGVARRWARERGGFERAPDRVGVIWVVAGVVLGVVMPTLGPHIQGLPDSIRFLCRVTAVLPIFLLLVYIGGGRSGDDGQERVATNRPLASLLLLPLGLIVVQSIVVTGVELAGRSTSWATLGGVFPFMADLPGRVGAASVLLPLIVVLQSLRRLWPRGLERTEALRREEQMAARQPKIWSRLWIWLLRFLGWLPREAEQPARAELEQFDDEGRPLWLMRLLDEAEATTPSSAQLRVDVAPFRGGWASSPPVDPSEESFVTWFPGMTPTRDQALAFERYLQLNSAALLADQVGEERPCADLLLVGEPGSGRSTTLQACILAAVTIRGQGALLLVPDRFASALAKKRLEKRIVGLGFEHLIRVKELDGAFVQDWVAAGEGGDGAGPVGLPEVLIATPEDLESRLIAHTGNTREMEALRALIGNYDALFIEDLAEFCGTQRIHLPFQLDKLRLVHAADLRQVQVLALARPMGKAAQATVGERLFGVKGFDANQSVVFLRPRVLARCWHAELRVAAAADVDRLRESIARLVVRAGLQAILYRRGIDPKEAQKQQRQIGTERLLIVGNLDELELRDDFEAQLGLYTEMPRVEERFQVRAGLGEVDVILSIGWGARAHRVESPTEVVPVLPQLEAEAVSALHLSSVLPLLGDNATVPIAAMLAVGFLEKLSQPVGGRLAPEDGWIVDGVDSIPGCGRLVYLGVSPQVRPLIDVGRVIGAERFGFFKHIESGRFVLRPTQRSAADLRAVATWRKGNAEGESLGTLELGHMGEMRGSEPRARYVPRGLELQPDGRLAIVAGAAVGPEQDATHPVIDLEARFEECDGVRIRFHSPERGLSLSSASNACGVVTTTLQSIANGFSGAESQVVPYQFDQLCWVGALLIGPASLSGEARVPVLQRMFEGKRSTATGSVDSGYLPALTAAMNRAIEVHFEGAAWFCRVAVFSLEGLGARRAAEAVCYIYEPEGTGASVVESLDQTLRHPEMSTAFLRSAMDVLDQLAAAEVEGGAAAQSACMRRLCSPCVTPGPAILLDESRRILESAISGEGRYRSPDPGWQVGGRDRAIVEAHDARFGRDWDESRCWTWAELSESLLEALEGPLAMLPDLTWQVALMGPAAETIGRDVVELARNGCCHVAYGDLHVTMRPLERAIRAEFARDLSQALEQIFSKARARQDVLELELRLWGTSRSLRRGAGQPHPLDYRMVVGVARDGRGAYRQQRPGVAPERLSPAPPPDVFIPEFVSGESRGQWECVSWYQRPEVSSVGDMEVAFRWRGVSYRIAYGAPDRGVTAHKQIREDYLAFLDQLPGRTGGPDYANHLANDPLAGFVADISSSLQAAYPGQVDADYAEFALRFVQAMPYIPDPARASDWPRFPSESLLLGGGDCEDSSMLYAALLIDAGLDAVWLSFEAHLAVGVRGPFRGRFYEHLGGSWFLAETAVDAGEIPIGSVSVDDAPLEAVSLCRRVDLLAQRELSILGAWLEPFAEDAWRVRLSLFSPGACGEVDIILVQRPVDESEAGVRQADFGPTHSDSGKGMGGSGSDANSGSRAGPAVELASEPLRLPRSPDEPSVIHVDIPVVFPGTAYFGKSAIDVLVLRDERPRKRVVAEWLQVATFLPEACA